MRRGHGTICIVTHPLPVRSSVCPGDLAERPQLAVIERGARVAGAWADALVMFDESEVSRRAGVGLGAVTSLPLLDALMMLPQAAHVRVCDLAPHSLAQLRSAPAGSVQWDGGWVLRLVTPPLTVVAAVVRGHGWRRPVSQVAHFANFAQQVVVLPRPPRAGSSVLWEAQLAGIGVWVCPGPGEVSELVAPAPFRRRYFKPATWRFTERALRAALVGAPVKSVATPRSV